MSKSKNMHIEIMFDQITSEIEKQEAEMCMGVHPDYFDTRPLVFTSDNSPIYEEDFEGEEDPDWTEEDDEDFDLDEEHDEEFDLEEEEELSWDNEDEEDKEFNDKWGDRYTHL